MIDTINERHASTRNNDDVTKAALFVPCPKCNDKKVRITFKAGREDRPVASFYCHPELIDNINKWLHTDIRNKRKRPDIEIVIEHKV